MKVTLATYIKTVLEDCGAEVEATFDVGVTVDIYHGKPIAWVGSHSSNRVKFTVTRVRAKDKPHSELAPKAQSKSNNKEDI